MTDDLIALQESLAFQADDLARLSEEVYVQQKEIKELRRLVDKLNARLGDLEDQQDDPASNSPEPPPPHY